MTTDAEGKVEFSFPKDAMVYNPNEVELQVSCFRSLPGGSGPKDWNRIPYVMLYEVTPGSFTENKDFTFRLIPYPVVTGKILDPNGKPISGAVLKIATLRQPTPEELEEMKQAIKSQMGLETAKEAIKYLQLGVSAGNIGYVHKEADAVTDADGAFQAMVSPGFNQGNIECNAPGFVPCRIDLKDRKIDKEEDWIFIVTKGTDVSGQVADVDGNGVADVWVNFNRKTINGEPLQGNIYSLHCDILGRSVKTDAQGRFVAASLDKEEYAVSVTTKPVCPNAENVERVESYEKPPLSENFVFANKSIDLRLQEGEEVKPEPLTIHAYPTVALKYVWNDETPDKSAISYSSISFNGNFPETNEYWNVQTERTYNSRIPYQQIGTVYLPKGLPFTLSGSLVSSAVREGVRTISEEKPKWTLEYRFDPEKEWKTCTELETNDSIRIHVNAPLEPLKEDEKTLELRVR